MDGNTTNFSHASPYNILSPEASTSLILLLGFFDIISIVANSLVLFTVYGNPRLRSNTNFFITNLCVVDLVCGLVLMPLVITSIAVQKERSGIMCEFLGFLDATYSSASSLTIALIALDRYHSIVNCLYYENIVTRHRTIIAILFIWIVTLFIAICPIIGWGAYHYDHSQYKCSLRQPDQHGFLWFTFCTAIIFPYLVIVFCYTQIHLVARRHARNMIAIHIHDTGKRIKAISTTKTKLVYLVVGIYTVCWMPFYTIKVLQNISIYIPESVVTIATMLSLVNGSCNPFLYALITSHFRVGMGKLYKRFRRKFGQPVATPSGDQSKSSWSVSKPISNLYRYFQENETGNMLACIGKTSSQDFKMEQQNELCQKFISKQADKNIQTLQIPRKGKKVERKDALERPFLSDNDSKGKGFEGPRKGSPYLDVIAPSFALNGRLSVITEDSREQCTSGCYDHGKEKIKQNKPCAVLKIQQEVKTLNRKVSQEVSDKNCLQIPDER